MTTAVPDDERPVGPRMKRRLRRLSIRHKLLAMALGPLLGVLPLLMLPLLAIGNSAFDRMLIAKVRSDLAVARGYFERVLAEVGADTAAFAGSHELHLALARRSSADLQPLLRSARSRAGFDFLNLRAVDGSLLVSDWGGPAGEAAGDMPANVPAARAPGAIGSGVNASLEVLAPSALAALAPSLQSRVALPIVATAGDAAGARTQEDRAMVVLASAPVRAPDGRLLGHVQGGVLLNRNLPFIDHINGIVYPEGSLPFGSQGTASLFLDDVRISTNVRLFGNERAVGTRASAAVRESVLGAGRTWLQRAFVVNDWYVSGYEPLHDGAGRRIGMLYVGYLERPFAQVKYAALGGIALVFLIAMALAALASLRWARGIFHPLEKMTRTMQRVEQGASEARVGRVASGDEIGQLAGHLDHLLDVVDDKTRALQRWNSALDAKVAERTRELEQSHATLQQAQQQLVRSERLATVGQLTAGIAHELNNPIAVLQGNLDLLRELLGPHAATVRDEIALIDEQAERMRLLMAQLLQFARPGEYAAYVDKVAPRVALDEALRLVAHLLGRSRIEVRRDDAATHAPLVNRRELQQVLVNLLANAVHAMPDGGTLMLATRDADGGVEISVADSGPGLSEGLLAQVFEPFVTRKKDGTGLGLWISRMIVERYGGELRAANRDDGAGGAVFSLRLPAQDAADPLSCGPCSPSSP